MLCLYYRTHTPYLMIPKVAANKNHQNSRVAEISSQFTVYYRSLERIGVTAQ